MTRIRRFLGSEVPNVIGQFSGRVGPFVLIHRLPGRRDPNRIRVERKLVGLRQIKNMGVRTGKLFSRLLTERVMPDDPIPETKTEFPSGQDAKVGSVLVSDRQIKATGGFKKSVHLFHPLRRPIQVLRVVAAVVVPIILVADIERRIGKNQIHTPIGHPTHHGHAIADDDRV